MRGERWSSTIHILPSGDGTGHRSKGEQLVKPERNPGANSMLLGQAEWIKAKILWRPKDMSDGRWPSDSKVATDMTA